MASQRYAVTQPPIDTVFNWIKSGEIAIPEIQRPFVWKPVKVRKFLDSLFRGYPVGYLIAWRNPNVKLKDGTASPGKRILIDGQQRVTALMAALLGREVVNKDYKRIRIRIAFHPDRQQFEVASPAIRKDPSWIPDISEIFDPHVGMFDFVNEYCERNPGTSKDEIFRSIEALRKITNNQIGLIELDAELDIETVTEIFIRVNSEGVPLNQADFAMSKIAVNETHGGNTLRKAIDYFCHLSNAPEFFPTLQNDQEFAQSEFFPILSWRRQENDDLYAPSYTDMLRVAFTSEFERGRLAELVALLSGRNFETRQYEVEIVEDSFARLKKSVLRFMNETNFKRFIMIIRSAGFLNSSMITSQNTLNFAYILFLSLRGAGVPNEEIERYVRRWFVMSVLTARYSGASETVLGQDIRRVQAEGIFTYLANVISGELSDAFWETSLPQEMNTSAASSTYFRLFEAVQIRSNDPGFLSRDINVRELVEVKSDVHHIFPSGYLKPHGLKPAQYNQIANYAVTQSEINIAIGKEEPRVYFARLKEQCNGGPRYYGNITDPQVLDDNLRAHCIPEGVEEMTVDDYPNFLSQRRELMARKIRAYFEGL